MGLLDRLRAARSPELADDEWERSESDARKRLHALLSSGDTEQDDPGSGVSEIHWAPRRPRATTVPPDRPGWWAVRLRGEQRWSIVEVLPDSKGRLMFAFSPHEPAKWTRAPWIESWGDRPYGLPLP